MPESLLPLDGMWCPLWAHVVAASPRPADAANPKTEAGRQPAHKAAAAALWESQMLRQPPVLDGRRIKMQQPRCRAK